jgi:hypothetical protein
MHTVLLITKQEQEGSSSSGEWTLPFTVQWLRLCELPFKAIAGLTNPLNHGIQVSTAP